MSTAWAAANSAARDTKITGGERSLPVRASPGSCSRFDDGAGAAFPSKATQFWREMTRMPTPGIPTRTTIVPYPSGNLIANLPDGARTMRCLLETTSTFIAAEDGAVTVDWVVMSAAIVGLGLAAMAVVSGGVEDLSGEVYTELASIEVGIEFGGALDGGFAGWTPYLGEDDIAEPWPVYFGEDRFTNEDLLGQIEQYSQYADAEAGVADYGHDHYWAAYEEAQRRGLDIPTT